MGTCAGGKSEWRSIDKSVGLENAAAWETVYKEWWMVGFYFLIIPRLKYFAPSKSLRNSFIKPMSPWLLLNDWLCNKFICFSYFSFFVTVLNGYSSVPISLCRDLDIRLNTAVKKIKYFDGGVEVTAENLKNNNSQVIHKGEKTIGFWKRETRGEVAR